MNKSILEPSLRSLSFQRNVFFSLTVLLSLAIIVLCCFLFLKRERVIIVPGVEREFWVDSGSVSPTYLEQMGVFLGQLLLNKSVQSATEQRAIILRHTDPSYSGFIRQKLIDEEEMLKKQNAAYTFYPQDVSVDVNRMEVMLEGDRLAYSGAKQVSMEKEKYLLRFVYNGSRLLLVSLQSGEKS